MNHLVEFHRKNPSVTLNTLSQQPNPLCYPPNFPQTSNGSMELFRQYNQHNFQPAQLKTYDEGQLKALPPPNLIPFLRNENWQPSQASTADFLKLLPNFLLSQNIHLQNQQPAYQGTQNPLRVRQPVPMNLSNFSANYGQFTPQSKYILLPQPATKPEENTIQLSENFHLSNQTNTDLPTNIKCEANSSDSGAPMHKIIPIGIKRKFSDIDKDDELDYSLTSQELNAKPGQLLYRDGQPYTVIYQKNPKTRRSKKLLKCGYPDCGKIFNKSCNMFDHLRIHSGERPFICSYEGCNKRFTQSGNLTKHLRLHTGDKKYICTYEGCNKKFAVSYNLKVHYRKHTGERPYKCEVLGCVRRFYDKGNLTYHEKACHNIVRKK